MHAMQAVFHAHSCNSSSCMYELLAAVSPNGSNGDYRILHVAARASHFSALIWCTTSSSAHIVLVIVHGRLCSGYSSTEHVRYAL
jgi:hypothetical protein